MRRVLLLPTLAVLSGCRPAFDAPTGLADDSPMCGDPFSARWNAVPGALAYEVEYVSSTSVDAGLYCRLTHPFGSGAACSCDTHEAGMPPACWDGATTVRVADPAIAMPPGGWSVHYRVRALGDAGTGAWSSSAIAGCWIE